MWIEAVWHGAVAESHVEWSLCSESGHQTKAAILRLLEAAPLHLSELACETLCPDVSVAAPEVGVSGDNQETHPWSLLWLE